MNAPMNATAPAPSALPLAGNTEADRRFFWFTAVFSALALGLLAWLLLIHDGRADSGIDLRFMPAVNACLNTVSTLCLVFGYVAVRQRRLTVHRGFMLGAYAASALFLVGYLAYHYVHGDTKFTGDGAVRVIYLLILATHVVLSMGIVPMALLAFWFAWKQQYARHKKLTRVLLPIWLYVSVTGVVIFFMLHGPRFFGATA